MLQEARCTLWDTHGTPLSYIFDMTILILTLEAIATLGVAGEAAILLTLIALLIAKELFEARPVAAADPNPSSRAFYLGIVPLALIFVAMAATRIVLP